VEFRRLADEIADFLLEESPVGSTFMGVHDRDDQLDDLDRDRVEANFAKRKEFIRRLDAVERSSLGLQDRIDLTVARQKFEAQVATFEQFEFLSLEPIVYPSVAVQGLYALFCRNPEPDETTLSCAASRLRQFGRLLEQGKKNLTRPPRIFTQMAIEFVKGSRSFLSKSIPQIAQTAPGKAEELLAANRAAQAALDDFEAFLEKELLARSDGTFVIGRDLFEFKLRKEHFLDYDVETLLEMGRETLAKTKEELARLAQKIDATAQWQDVIEKIKSEHPGPEELKQAYERSMRQARQFVEDKGLVEVPKEEKLLVVDTPEFARFYIPYAAYSSPGPFEKQQLGLFFVTPVDPKLPSDQQEKILRDHPSANIRIIALHEAYPGHHLQLVKANLYPSRLRHFFHNTVFVEGWALYCEEMMRQMGFLADPKTWLLQLKAQMWRAARVILDASLHTAKVSFDEAVEFLMREAMLQRHNAVAEVKRYTMSPTQPMSYLLGKDEIKRLKSKVEAKQGARFNLAGFHNQLLSFGSLPTKLIAECMLQ